MKNWAMVLLVAFALAACQPGDSSPPPDEVSLQLKWVHQAQFAGYYAAQALGYYDEENIDLTILEAIPGEDSQQAVVDGTAQFGVAGGGELIVARAGGRPLVALATIYRISPRVYLVNPESGIDGPVGFRGQTIYEVPGGVPILQAMTARVGITPDQYTIISEPYDINLFASGEVPVWDVYLNGSISNFQQAGYDFDIIYPSDYGIHFYGDTIFSTDEFVDTHPGLTTRFLRATLRGWQWAVEHPEEAGALALEYDPELDKTIQIEQMKSSIPLIRTGQDHIGWMLESVWQGMRDTLVEQGVVERPVALDELYTTAFLERVYGEGG